MESSSMKRNLLIGFVVLMFGGSVRRGTDRHDFSKGRGYRQTGAAIVGAKVTVINAAQGFASRKPPRMALALTNSSLCLQAVIY